MCPAGRSKQFSEELEGDTKETETVRGEQFTSPIFYWDERSTPFHGVLMSPAPAAEPVLFMAVSLVPGRVADRDKKG